MKAFFNDDLLNYDEISLSPEDLIVQRGYGIFDFFRIVGGKPLFMDNHLDRFISSAELAKFPLRWNKDQLAQKVLQLLGVNNEQEGGIKILLTGGISPMGFQLGEPNLIIMQNKAKSPPAEVYQNGGALITYEYLRDVPAVKTINYFTGIWLYPEMQKQQALDVLYYQSGKLLELSRSNVFLVSDGKVLTPKHNMLSGITRRKVLELANRSFEVEVRDVAIEEIWEAEEIFITSTLKKVLPIVKIDGKTIGEGRPGAMTHHLIEQFEQLILDSLNQ